MRKCLGEGGFGHVYEAWDPRLSRSVALKRLKMLPGQPGNAHLIDEARLAASLQHSAFVKIFAFEDAGDGQAIVMELVEGTTLRLGQDGVTPDQALDIVDQVALAMSEAHRCRLVHGDIKPGNLMLEPSGTVRILDFGLARKVDPLTTQSGLPEDPQGTIAYMAPERLMGQPPQVGSDVYALGVVLYELIAGARPFAGLDGLALAAAHMQSSSEHWVFPPHATPGTVALVRAMTARDPLLRLPSMTAVRERIGALRGTPAAPGPAAGLPRPGAAGRLSRRLPWPRSWRLSWRTAALLALAAGAGLAAWLVPQEAARQWASGLAPYSEARSMQSGLEALRLSDREGELDTALRQFDSILAHRPGHAGAAAGQSIAFSMRYLGDGRDEAWLRRADASSQQALKEDDQLALAHAARAWVLALQGQGSAALAAADRALALDPSDLSALNAKANVLLRMRRYEEAALLVAAAQARYPRERLFADLEGTLHYQRGHYAAAETAFRRSLQLEPDAVLGYANLNAALLRQDKVDAALEVLQQGLQVRPSGALYGNLGTTLFARGDYVGAARAFERAVSSAKGAPNDFLKWANLADSLRWIPGREKDARMAYLRATQLLAPILQRQPEDPTLLTRMGLYAAHLDDPAAALALSERGVSIAPDNPDVRFRAALANEIGGRRTAAIAHLARAQALGYPPALIASEPDLIALRRDSRYQTLAMDNNK